MKRICLVICLAAASLMACTDGDRATRAQERQAAREEARAAVEASREAVAKIRPEDKESYAAALAALERSEAALDRVERLSRE